MGILLDTSKKLFRKYAALTVWLIVCGGCNDRGFMDVQGNITLDGEPLRGGVILFEPVDGNGATAGGKIRDGRYELTKKAAVPPGEKCVRITGFYKTGRQIEEGPPAAPGTMADEIKHIAIPAIYNQISTLRITVVAGENNQHDFELRSR